MSNNDCGGWIFNRHKWEYPVDGLRFCIKCGETEEHNIGFFDTWWQRIDGETFINRLAEYRSWHEAKISNYEWGKEKVLEMFRDGKL
jgi:hypothetical protein